MKRLLFGALLGTFVLLLAVESAQAQRMERRGLQLGSRTIYLPTLSRYREPYYTEYAEPGTGYYYEPAPARPGLLSRLFGRGMYSEPIYQPGYSGVVYSSEDAVVMDSRTGGYRSLYTGPEVTEKQAMIRVLVPMEDAKVWFETAQTKQTGTDRVFVSPELDTGKTYTYKIKVTWMENGKEVSREKTVDLQAGQDAVVNFIERRRGREVEYRDGGVVPARYEERPGLSRRSTLFMHRGEFVRASNGEMVMTTDSNQRMTHPMMRDTEVWIEGKQSRMEDLKPGMKVEVTTTRRGVVTRIDVNPSERRRSEPPK